MASVASAAIIEGNLIIGLDDGSIINCGFVQGPQGLKGDPGPMGATGDNGLDGNTIHTVAGTPRNDMGRDGDYAIDNINWRIYGPKSGGVWGKAKSMLPDKENLITNGREGGGSGGGSMGGGGDGSGGGDPGRLVFTSTVIATGSGRLTQSGTGTTATVSYPGSPNGIISPEAGMNVQANINGFFVKALEELEVELPVATSDTDPGEPKYDGKLWFDTSENELTLYIYYDGQWVPASPPVSLDGIKNSIVLLEEVTTQLQADVATTVLLAREEELKVLALQESQAEQDTKIEALETSQNAQDVRLDEAAFVNQDNTFASNKTNTFKGDLTSEKQLTIAAPSNTNYNPTFQIRGTARTGTVNSVVLRATQSGSRMRVTYRGPIDEDDELTTKKYVEDRLGGDKPDGPKAWRYIPIGKWNPGSVETGTFTIDKDNAKIYLNCHDEDGNWWVYRTRTETYTTPQPHFTVYAATGTMVWDASVYIADFYKVVNDQRITTLEYSSASSYYWNNYFKENHYFVIHFLSYLPNFRERHLEKLNPTDSTYVVEPDGVQLDEIEEL